MTDEVLFTQKNHIGIITLNRVRALNALTLPMILAMQEQLVAWKKDSQIHAVIVRAAEGKAFCAGGDVRWLYQAGLEQSDEQMEFFWHEYQLNHFIHHFGKPYISLMDGITMGGGVGISLHGSHPIATENFCFAMPETSIGFFPDIGASYLLSRCPGEYGTYLALTGDRINSTKAQSLGLVRFIINSNQIDALIDDLVSLDLASDAHEVIDDCIKNYASALEIDDNDDHKIDIENSFRFNRMELIIAALEEGLSTWHQQVLKILQNKAPLSLKVTFEQIKKASSLNLAQCLEMDFKLVSHFMQDHDFYEGVRALLINKDKQPKWKPATINQVSEELVTTYFESEQNALEFTDL